MQHATLAHPAEAIAPPEQQGGWDGHTTFLEKNAEKLHELFTELDMPWQNNLDDIVAKTQPWVVEHHQTAGQVQPTAAQAARRRALYEEMGLVDEVALPAGTYDQIIILGAMQSANVSRIAFMKRMFEDGGVELATDGLVSLWGGVRESIPEMEDDWFNASQTALGAERRAKSRDPWLRSLKPEDKITNESEGLRIAAHELLGDMALQQELLDGEMTTEWQFISDNGHTVSLLHSGAVPRNGIGAPRHTTESCARQWLDAYGHTLPEGARIGFVTSQPCGLRTTRAFQAVVDQSGRSDLQIVGGGPAGRPGLPDHMYRGEIGRNIYEDSLRAVAEAA